MTVMYALTVRALQQQLKEQRRMTVTNSGRSRSSGLYGAFYADIFYASANIHHHHHHHHHHQNAGFRVAHNNELLLRSVSVSAERRRWRESTLVTGRRDSDKYGGAIVESIVFSGRPSDRPSIRPSVNTYFAYLLKEFEWNFAQILITRAVTIWATLLRFRRYGLKLPIDAHFRGGGENISQITRDWPVSVYYQSSSGRLQVSMSSSYELKNFMLPWLTHRHTQKWFSSGYIRLA